MNRIVLAVAAVTVAVFIVIVVALFIPQCSSFHSSSRMKKQPHTASKTQKFTICAIRNWIDECKIALTRSIFVRVCTCNFRCVFVWLLFCGVYVVFFRGFERKGEREREKKKKKTKQTFVFFFFPFFIAHLRKRDTHYCFYFSLHDGINLMVRFNVFLLYTCVSIYGTKCVEYGYVSVWLCVSVCLSVCMQICVYEIVFSFVQCVNMSRFHFVYRRVVGRSRHRHRRCCCCHRRRRRRSQCCCWTSIEICFRISVANISCVVLYRVYKFCCFHTSIRLFFVFCYCCCCWWCYCWSPLLFLSS